MTKPRTRILVISYRENGADYCRGCLMDSSNSEFEVCDTESDNEAISFLADVLLKQKTSESGLEYSSRDNRVYVNGISKDTNIDDDAFGDSPDYNAKSLAQNIELWAQQEFEKKLAAHQETLAQVEAARQARVAEQQRQDDLRQLNHLKKKLGVS